jgi:hypothetical protein
VVVAVAVVAVAAGVEETLCGFTVVVEGTATAPNARRMAPKTRIKPMKTRGSKKAERDGFFFMGFS